MSKRASRIVSSVSKLCLLVFLDAWQCPMAGHRDHLRRSFSCTPQEFAEKMEPQLGKDRWRRYFWGYPTRCTRELPPWLQPRIQTYSNFPRLWNLVKSSEPEDWSPNWYFESVFASWKDTAAWHSRGFLRKAGIEPDGSHVWKQPSSSGTQTLNIFELGPLGMVKWSWVVMQCILSTFEYIVCIVCV